ncbi:conserved hypothetical protein [Sulfobacillus acidophilus TPY]|uniref:MotA/TolQ/ExbB proton channel domain-containing protein n=1 Tax=Sulfobacillus acidophilus (strain ATCC 700253 / DSM 10332 / NAL) TaxID=679936 RepID=G8TV49_SULAD|nr:conserved hypothetical protein [Sulfobacillus acidophilus TPY]AEW03630.1 hypothetical protein Sulac_0056 [Sulfobacillus acidophilus DSM 10332]
MGNPGNWIYYAISWVGSINRFGALYLWLFLFLTSGVLVWRIRVEGGIRSEMRQLTAYLKEHGTSLPTVDQWFHDHPNAKLRPLWQQYVDAVQHHQDGDPVHPDIGRFFSEDAILLGIANRRITEAVPSLLTMAGILGTFLGLVAGLHGLNPNAPNGLGAGIGQLVGGLSLKFTSSVYGIFLALVWMVADRFWYRSLYEAVVALQEALIAGFSAPPEELSLQQIKNILEDQRQTLYTLTTDTLIPQLIEGFSQALQTQLFPPLDELIRQQHQTTASLDNFGQQMTLMAERTATAQVDGLERIAHEFINQMSAQTVEVAERLHESLQQTVTVQERIATLATDLLQHAEPLLARFQETQQLQKQLWEQGHQVHTVLLEGAQYWSTFHTEIRGTLETTEHRLEAFFSAVELRTGTLLKDLQALEETFIAESRSVVHHIQSLNNQWEEHLRLLTDRQAALGEWQKTYEEQISRALGDFPRLVQDLRESSLQVSRETERALTQWQDRVAGDLENLTALWTRQSREFTELAQTLQTQFQTELQQTVAQFQDVGQALGKAAHQLRKEAGEALEQLQTNLTAGLQYTFSQFDKELGQAVTHLSGGVHVLEQAIKSLSQPVNHLKTQGEALTHEVTGINRHLKVLNTALDKRNEVAE